MPLSIDVVIPVHNGWMLTVDCLDHLRRQTVDHNVIVCDNASTDGTRQRLRRSYPDVHLIELGANLGFAVACNTGARWGHSEVVVLLNNDVTCRPQFLERLVAPLYADATVGSVAALLVRPGKETIESFGLAVDPTLAGYPRLRGHDARDAQPSRPVLLGPSGAAGAYRREAWDGVGGLDEAVFAYSEDVDLAMRLRAAGWSAAAAVDAVAVHVGSATARARSSSQRYRGGYARGYFLRRYAVLRTRHAARAVAAEAIAVAGDALVFSHDLAALRGRFAGWRAGRGLPRNPWPPDNAIDTSITFLESLRLRLGVYTGRA
jgi:N-acetylglucosaminyl-diphospho-decaprenol L-rhamnosyltransferase